MLERSLVDSIEADYEYIGDEPKISSNAEEHENIEVSRRRRDSLDKEEESPNIEEVSKSLGFEYKSYLLSNIYWVYNKDANRN